MIYLFICLFVFLKEIYLQGKYNDHRNGSGLYSEASKHVYLQFVQEGLIIKVNCKQPNKEFIATFILRIKNIFL